MVALPHAVAPDTTSEAPSIRSIPTWPFTTLFLLAPVWWLLGLFDVIWIISAVIMAVLLMGRGHTLAPRWFGLLLVFLGMVLISGFGLSLRGGSAGIWGYRAAHYIAAVILFVYVYNLRTQVTERFILRGLVGYWITTVAGGFLGLLIPYAQFKTVLYYALQTLAPTVLGTELVQNMVIHGFAQGNPNSYLGAAPRPIAPFLFTNNWGNVYSLLLPLVIAFLVTAPRRTRSWWLLAALVPISTVPAFLTLNRGMFIGIGMIAAIIAIRFAWHRDFRGIKWLAILGVATVILINILPVQSRLETRLQGDGTTTRASVYVQALELIPESPLIGFGAPVTSPIPNEPPIGTQGQFWMLLISHGPLALAVFCGFFLIVGIRAMRRTDLVGITLSAGLVVSVIELFYYGVLPYGLPVMAVMAALASLNADLPDHPTSPHLRSADL